ncbi:hypothetical protein ACP4OV_017284 [Aristida adscensionis]
MHGAACAGHLNVCKYLMEGLSCDHNMETTDCEGVTLFMAATQSRCVETVSYLIACGGNIPKSDANGRTILHHAVCTAL